MVHLGNFDASQVEPTPSFDPIPAGKYLAMITASEMKPNKAGTGSYLELVVTILEGEYKDRQLWVRLNLDNPNELAVKIARAELSAICRAVGVLTPRDSVELHNLPLVIKVACKKRKDTDEIANVIRGYERRDSLGGRPQQAQSNTPPWRR
ncbi:MAG TPA: DUF669 domain-containing protein [Phycisphaerae bacterium]|nr:DUF669 domain-containing protein [Phycisphaerae bacterium]